MSDQLRIGDRAESRASEPMFATDDGLAGLLIDVEAVLRGVLEKITAVRRHLQGRYGPVDVDPDPNSMRRALEYLSDVDAWLGDPHDQRSILFGDATPFELAAEALGRAA